MALQVPQNALPGLDAKGGDLSHRPARRPGEVPGVRGQASDLRTMGDADIRRAAGESNRLLQSPVKALRRAA